MAKFKSKLGCISSLFTCFGGSSKRKQKKNQRDTPESPETADGHYAGGGGDGGDVVVRRLNDSAILANGHCSSGSSNGTTGEKKRVTIQRGENGGGSTKHFSLAQSPRSDSTRSMGSAVSRQSQISVYYDASDGCDAAANAADNDNDYFDNGTFDFDDTLQIDGQYFFTAMDDPTISQETFDGIRLYPPLPTTCPDPVPPRSPISTANMQTLLHDYQHEADDTPAKQLDIEANLAASQVGIALEMQAKRLLALNEDAPIDYVDECTHQLLHELKRTNVREKGFPGELTNLELEAVKRFQYELQTRPDQIYHQIVHSFGEVESEAYALCRFLRARQFDVDKVFELLDVAKEHFAIAKACNFYPDLEKDMGVSRSVFLSQYPAVFCGNAKNGCPVMYLKLGSIQPEGIKCVVSLDKVDRFFWNDLMYTFTNVLKEGGRRNPHFVRTENIAVYDLKGVSRSQITSDTFEMIKIGNQVMTSFPETLHCLLIINAPTWFGVVWSVAKKLIDARTASKIEVFTNSKTGLKRMVELIDESQISSDCGGTGPTLAEAASSEAGSKRVVLNKLMRLTKKSPEYSYNFELLDDKQITLTIYTRCKEGATAGLHRSMTTGATETETRVTEIDIVGEQDDVPYSRTIGGIVGPGNFTVRLKGNSQHGVFLMLGTINSCS